MPGQTRSRAHWSMHTGVMASRFCCFLVAQSSSPTHLAVPQSDDCRKHRCSTLFLLLFSQLLTNSDPTQSCAESDTGHQHPSSPLLLSGRSVISQPLTDPRIQRMPSQRSVTKHPEFPILCRPSVVLQPLPTRTLNCQSQMPATSIKPINFTRTVTYPDADLAYNLSDREFCRR